MSLDSMIQGGSSAYVYRLEQAGYDQQQILLRLAERFPNEAPQTYYAAINRADQAQTSGYILYGMGQADPDARPLARQVQDPRPGCLGWLYTVVGSVTDQTGGEESYATYTVFSPVSMSFREVLNDVTSQAEDIYGPGGRGGRYEEYASPLIVGIAQYVTVERSC